MDECLVSLCFRFFRKARISLEVELGLKKIGEMDTELFQEFFKAFVNESKCNLTY